MKIIGIIPARMAASRFPGKPLYPILGMPMMEHVYHRARMFQEWDTLAFATCDQEIAKFAKSKGYPVVMTGSHHTRALDRVAEAALKLNNGTLDDDAIVVNVQGDEPMMSPDMIAAVVQPLKDDPAIPGTMLGMLITEESIWRNPDTVKIIHNDQGEVLYTTRAPVPYCKGAFSSELGARRIYGIFGFHWSYLDAFTAHCETRLEQLEACDSNRILDMEFRQRVALYPYVPSFSVDSPEDIALVEQHMASDQYWSLYK